MAQLFEKLKGSLAPLTKLRAIPPLNPPTIISPEPASLAPASTVSESIANESTAPESNVLESSAPETIAVESPDQPITPQIAPSSPVMTKPAPTIKISRITRVAKRPQPVMHESRENDTNNVEDETSRRVHVVSRKPMSQIRKRKVRIIKPKFRVAS